MYCYGKHMRRLIWGFAGDTYHIVGNLMSRLKCNQLDMNEFWSKVILFLSSSIEEKMFENVEGPMLET